ncbi:hypothetical protein Desor_2808 [Desulfosporosinus orientis DSM 765]|uniref:DUF4349 domain-containing protein n=1 Tax=Desulfosporosinus orientis (strain ATCC 19365 / DSM 765 / NCIMB 8382 / VKM B-1628 / Singapore I) TaxID=768706 RepID=G7WDM1_DESOD|nr:DUF4349 domain-containing protein [Desulfosporosinus orientis]AET68346.1 hypothetical protein Desor_2808 [Desulfosporosinus orientis DSM 765]
MKGFFDKKDLTVLWEEDGDLQRMKEFFSTIDGDTEDKETIKLSIKQKALEKLAKTEGLEDLPVYQPRYEKKGFKQWTSLGWWKSPGQWKLALPIAALAILIVIGQGALSNSWSIFPRMGSSEKSTQSADIAMQAPPPSDSTGAGTEFNVKSKSFSNSAEVNGGAEHQPQTQFGMDSTSIMENKAVLPVPPDQGNVPPADEEMPRKVTHNLDLTLEVANINESVDKISQEIQSLGGYVVTSQQSDSDNYSSAYLTVKIPADKLNGLQDSVSSWGKVLDQRLQANDITNEYYDSQARLQVLEAEEKRYLEILEQAKTVDDVLRVEDSLSNVRQQIEQLKGQLKLWDHQVNYSTVTFQIVTHQTPNLNVKDPWQPVSWSETWQAAKDAVLKTLSSTWNGLNYLVVGLGYAIPYLLIGGIAWGIYRFWKKRNR